MRVGIEATGSMQWFVSLMEELGIECLVGHPEEIRRAAEAETRSARCGLDSEVADGKSLSSDLAAFEGATGSAVFVAAPSSVGCELQAMYEKFEAEIEKLN